MGRRARWLPGVRAALLVALSAAGCAASRSGSAASGPRVGPMSDERAVELTIEYMIMDGGYRNAGFETAEAAQDTENPAYWMVRVRKKSNPEDYFLFKVNSRTGEVLESAVIDDTE